MMITIPMDEANREFKFNGGYGAVLCSSCGTIVCEGLKSEDPTKAARVLHRVPIVECGMVFCSEAHAKKHAERSENRR
jgi:hypothetical protein